MIDSYISKSSFPIFPLSTFKFPLSIFKFPLIVRKRNRVNPGINPYGIGIKITNI